MTYSIETIRRVYNDAEGVYIEIGPDGDALGGIEIRTTTQESKDYYGDIRVALFGKKFTRKIIDALEAAYNEMEEDK